MRIQHNISALNSWGKLGINQNNASKNLEKLSSGYRINRAGDDAAGLAISEKMRGQIRGLDMASKNAQDGISLIQTAEGALDETHSILQRMRELAVQSANGTYQDEDRQNTDLEVQALKSELDRIASSTHFNKIQLLDGSLSAGATSGTAGKAAAKVTISDQALSDGALKINAATKGVYETSMGGKDPFSAIQADATNEYTITYKDTDGNLKNETVTLKFNATDGKIVDADGNTLKDVGGSTASIEQTVEALKAALEKTSLGDNFKIETKNGDVNTGADGLYGGGTPADTNGKEGLKFTAKTAGASAPSIVSITQRNGGVGSKAVGQGAVGSKTITVDLSGVDLSKIKVGDELQIGNAKIKFEWQNATAASAGDKANDTGTGGAAGIVYLKNIQTTDDLAEAIKTALSTEAGTNTLKTGSSFGGGVNTAWTFSVGQGGAGHKSELVITLGTSLGNTTNQMEEDVQTFMNNFVYTPTGGGASVTGGYIGLGTAPKTYDVTTTKTADDRYESYDMSSIKAWNPGDDTDDIANHIFEVNGEKFLFVKQNATNQAITDDAITKATAIYGNSLNVVAINTTNNDKTEGSGKGVSVSELDVITMAERIKEKTGTNVRVNGTKLEFLATPGTNGGSSDGKLVFQIGANGSADQRVSMSIEDMSSKGIGVDQVDITTADTANKAIDVIDQAINTVSGTRANLGAMQNRLEHTINSLNTSSENLTAAESRIRDVDMAKEMMAFTKNNILTQAAQAMLAQANQQPQGVLQLLQ